MVCLQLPKSCGMRHTSSALRSPKCSLRPRADKHLTGLAEWNPPSAGMFLWIKLLAGVTDADQIFELLKDARVVVVPGASWILHCSVRVLSMAGSELLHVTL